jgi:hypothetical protein
LTQVASVGPSTFEQLCDNIQYLLEVGERKNEVLVCANAAFDLAVLCRFIPEAIPIVFELLEKGLVEDVLLREKFLHLTAHGDLDFHRIYDDHGEVITARKLEYGLGALSKYYLGKDRGNDKEASDAWRKYFSELEKINLEEWPAEAVKYVSEDAEDTWVIRELQEQERLKCWQNLGIDPFRAQAHRVKVAFSLHMMSIPGIAIDAEAKARVDAMLAEELRPEKMPNLIKLGILVPGKPETTKTLKNGTIKTVKGTKDKISQTTLRALVKTWCEENKVEVQMTVPSEKNPDGQVSIGMEFFETNQKKHVVFQEYYDRQKLQKLVTTEMPRLQNEDGSTASVVHPSYDALKSTGRTSSFASSIYPSTNIQNVDPRARQCYVPRPGKKLMSVDYNQMELGTAAQVCFDLFGHSVLKDKINAGVDVHTYLGAQLAYHLNSDFKKSIDDNIPEVTADAIFEAFMKCKKSPDEAVRKFFAHYRKFAKPTGLGYPGGLGAQTFIDYAWATYRIDVDLEMAKNLKQIWLSTFPEFDAYFKHLPVGNKDLIDPDSFAYFSPMGMYRAGCNYCAVANGQALQTPSAEGATLAGFNLVRACYDSTQKSILLNTVRPIAFIHDEFLLEIDAGDGSLGARKLRHEQAKEVARIMVDAMRVVTPDVTPRATPVLMDRWDKLAEPVYDKDGLLDVWRPEPKK